MLDERNDELREDEDLIVLLDENGNELRFEVLAEAELEGKVYWALLPLDDTAEDGSYVIVLVEGEGDDATFTSIEEDDEVFEPVSEFFDDLFFDVVDYD